ncbi:NEUR3 protein, partial [Trogon melanurus]|nr:NEUR3 protein [Trogon melanurus]
RLVVPGGTYYVHGRLCGGGALACCTRQHARGGYSDDGGRSWRGGAMVGGAQTGEGGVAEIGASGAHRGGLYCSARALRRGGAVTFSADRGLGGERSARCKALSGGGRGCQGSVVSLGGPTGGSGDATTGGVYSHPTDRHHRRDLGVYLNPSPLGGDGWWHPWVLHGGAAGYSDLAVCRGGFFGCLFECGTGGACEEITFCLFGGDTSDHGEQNLKVS